MAGPVVKTRRRVARAQEVGVGGEPVATPAPSQDDERLPTISASARAGFKRCRYAWHFRYMEKLEPKHTAAPLRFGTLIHTALEHYYIVGVKRGPHPARVFEKAYEKEFGEARALGFKDDDGKWHDALSLGVDMLEHYVDHYGKDDAWEVIASEQMFRQPVYDAAGKQVGVYIGVLDIIMRERSSGNIWIWDHKSAKSIDTSYLAMDDQSSGYWTYGPDFLREAGILKPGQDLTGIQFNFLRKAKRDERQKNERGQYLNLDGTVSMKQPPEFFKRHPSFRGEAERQHTRERIVAELAEIAMVKKGVLAMLKTPDKMNCKFCDVRDICELHEVGADWAEMMRLIMVPRRPPIREVIEFEHEH